MEQKGFTLVELLVVILIMGLLLTMGTINLRNNQVDSRDNERATDTQNISRSLESRYATALGSYPPTASMNTEATAISTLNNINNKSMRAPGITTSTTFTVATNATTTTTGVTPQPTINQYVYQPIASDNTLCATTTQECRSFYLYYREERTNAIVRLESKNK